MFYICIFNIYFKMYVFIYIVYIFIYFNPSICFFLMSPLGFSICVLISRGPGGIDQCNFGLATKSHTLPASARPVVKVDFIPMIGPNMEF